jgi:hypothetical protein
MRLIKRFWWVGAVVVLYVIGLAGFMPVGASNIQVAIPVTCGNMPALTGDTTSSAGTCVTATGKINGGAFAGVNGNLVSFGPSNTPADSGVKAASLPQITTGILASADILSLNTVAVQAIAAQGSGIVTLVDRVVLNLVAGSSPYAGTGTISA